VTTWPGEDLAHQYVLYPDPEFGIPYGVHVFVFKDRDALQRAAGDARAAAHSITYDEQDSRGVQAVVMLAQPVSLSLVIHEVTHTALYWARKTTRRKQRALGWLNGHTEDVPDLIGNLSAVIWYTLPAELCDATGQVYA
jgi:hypothetical protein